MGPIFAVSQSGTRRSAETRRSAARCVRRIGVVLVGLVLVAGCGGGTSAGGTGPITIAGFGPFSGVDASFGPNLIAGCYPATRLINMAGGILTHKVVQCKPVDSKGDPA